MATKSLIGRTNQYGNVDFVQVTYDGAIAVQGVLLQHDWQDDGAIAQLIDGGNIHVVGQRIGTAHDGRAAPPVAAHVQDTVFNIRDRGGDPAEEKTQLASDPAAFWAFEFDNQQTGARQKWQARYLWTGSEWLTLDPKTQLPVALAAVLDRSYVVSTVRHVNDGDIGVAVEILGDEEFAPHAHGTLAEFVQFMDQTTSYEVATSRIEDMVFSFADEGALVALRLRYNILDHELRSMEA